MVPRGLLAGIARGNASGENDRGKKHSLVSSSKRIVRAALVDPLIVCHAKISFSPVP